MICNSTPFLSYDEINVDNLDLYEDAFGLYPEISGFPELNDENELQPERRLVDKLIDRIRKIE